MPKLIVYYPRHDGCSFDRGYYEAKHVPMVSEGWGPLGLTGAEIAWPADEGQPFACHATLEFADASAIDAALGSAATAGILADVANFTDIQPGIYRSA